MDQPVDLAGLAKAHLRLLRMDVDVNELGGDLDLQEQRGMSSLRHRVPVRGRDGVGQHAVLHGPTVDEHVLGVPPRQRVRGSAGETPRPGTGRPQVEGQQPGGELPAVELGDPSP